MLFDTRGGPDDPEVEGGTDGMDCSEGTTQGWTSTSTCVPEVQPSEGDQQPEPFRFTGMPRELPSSTEQTSSDEVRPEGWRVDLECRDGHPISHKSVSRGPTTSPSWKRERSDPGAFIVQAGSEGPGTPPRPDSEEFERPGTKRPRRETLDEQLQLEGYVGPEKDTDPVGSDGDGEDGSSEGSSSWGGSSETLGSSEGSDDGYRWSDLRRYEFQSPPQGSPDSSP